MRIINSALLIVLLFSLVTEVLRAEDTYSVEQVPIPRDEQRQQALLGLREFRYAYSLPNDPENVQVIVECYSFGRLRHRYRGVLAPNFRNHSGIVSVGWISRDRELITVVDNELPYSPVSRRQLVDKADFDEPMESFSFLQHTKKEGMIPLFGVCGQRGLKVGAQAYETPQDFIQACGKAKAQFCWVVYLHVDSNNQGGSPRFSDGK